VDVADRSASSRSAVQAFLAAWQARDREALGAVLHADVEWVTPPSAGLGPFRGRERVVEGLTGGASGLIDVSTLRRHVGHVIAEGEHAAVSMTMSATTTQGNDYSNNYVWWFTCRDDLIVRLVEHTDTLAAARAFGWVTDAIAR
jgi:ketosteroid isomerase-like protein